MLNLVVTIHSRILQALNLVFRKLRKLCLIHLSDKLLIHWNYRAPSSGTNAQVAPQTATSDDASLETSTVDEAALIEERRKRREAIKAKYRSQATPLLVQALHLGNDSGPATPGAEDTGSRTERSG